MDWLKSGGQTGREVGRLSHGLFEIVGLHIIHFHNEVMKGWLKVLHIIYVKASRKLCYNVCPEMFWLGCGDPM